MTEATPAAAWRTITGADLMRGDVVRVAFSIACREEIEIGKTDTIYDVVADLLSDFVARRFCVLMEAHARHGKRVPGGYGYLRWTRDILEELDPDDEFRHSMYAKFSGVWVEVTYADGETMRSHLMDKRLRRRKGTDVVWWQIELAPVIQMAAEAKLDALAALDGVR